MKRDNFYGAHNVPGCQNVHELSRNIVLTFASPENYDLGNKFSILMANTALLNERKYSLPPKFPPQKTLAVYFCTTIFIAI